ncbi:MAG: DUF4276 family protein [Saprospiraceae bacterium]|nr:DUF4276 family protein [Saprospiraceae bacterium]
MIGEGESETVLLSSQMFRCLLSDKQISFVSKVINAGGKGNLLNNQLDGFIYQLIEKGATHILILTDYDNAPCFTSIKEKVQSHIKSDIEILIIIPKKELEAWFIACKETMKLITGTNSGSRNPENIDNPFKYIMTAMNKSRQRKSTFSKPALAKKFLDRGFTITRASENKECPSAAYFLKKITALGST